jgi:ribosomal protein L37AE/L43A
VSLKDPQPGECAHLVLLRRHTLNVLRWQCPDCGQSFTITPYAVEVSFGTPPASSVPQVPRELGGK